MPWRGCSYHAFECQRKRLHKGRRSNSEVSLLEQQVPLYSHERQAAPAGPFGTALKRDGTYYCCDLCAQKRRCDQFARSFEKQV